MEIDRANATVDYRMAERPRLLQIVTAPVSANCLLRGQLAFMREQGFDVTVISSPGELLDQAAERESIAAIGVPMRREPSVVHDIRSLLSLIRIIRKLDPHIVQYSTPKAGLLASIASVVSGVRIRLYTLRGMRADGLKGLPARAMVLLERIPCALSLRTICVSQSLKLRATELKLCKNSKLQVLSPQSSNGVDSNWFCSSDALESRGRVLKKQLGIPNDAFVIGFVGRLCVDKGGRELLESFAAIRRAKPSVHLLCVGPTETGRNFPDWIQDVLDEDGNVHATGLVSDPRPAYSIIDVLVLPTYREGFPNVALEAAAMEIPVVATQVTGCVDAIVDGFTGALVPARDAPALVDAVMRYLDSPRLRREHGKAARQRAVDQFKPESVWLALRDVYIDLLKANDLPTPTREAQARECEKTADALLEATCAELRNAITHDA